MELYQAIIKMEQDGSVDGVLQVCLIKHGPRQAFRELFEVHFHMKISGPC